MLMPEVRPALRASVAITLAALALFGGVKGRLTGVKPIASAIQTLLIGGLAAAVAFAIARLVSG